MTQAEGGHFSTLVAYITCRSTEDVLPQDGSRHSPADTPQAFRLDGYALLAPVWWAIGITAMASFSAHILAIGTNRRRNGTEASLVHSCDVTVPDGTKGVGQGGVGGVADASTLRS